MRRRIDKTNNGLITKGRTNISVHWLFTICTIALMICNLISLISSPPIAVQTTTTFSGQVKGASLLCNELIGKTATRALSGTLDTTDIEDTHITEASETPQGNNAKIILRKSDTWDYEGLVKVSQAALENNIPPNAKITSGRFLFRQENDEDLAQWSGLHAYRVTGNWNENGVTWSSAPNYGAVLGSASHSNDPPADLILFEGNDMTTAVQNWFDGTWQNHGIHLIIEGVANEGIYIYLHSSECANAALKPSLYVQYLYLNAPVLTNPGDFDVVGSHTVGWSASSGANSYTLEEDTSSSFDDNPKTIYSGPQRAFTVEDNPPGTYYYRVRADDTANDVHSPWSNMESIEVLEDDDYEDNDLSENAAVLGEGAYSNLKCYDDDWYKVDLYVGSDITISISFTHSDGDINLKLYGIDGTTVLEKSEGSLDSETINYKIDVSGYYYVKVYCSGSDINDYNMQITIVPDTQAPTGLSILINDGDDYTTSTSVELVLSATDSACDVSKMMISNQASFSGSNWEPYSTSKPWELISSDGGKTVYYKVKDEAGNVANTVSDSITLDSSAPTGLSIFINDGDDYTTSTSVELVLSATDSVCDVSEMMISNKVSFSGSNWELYSTSKSWVLTNGEGSKTVYFNVRDEAGNVANIVSDSIILDTIRPTVESKFPAKDAKDVPLDASITVTFNEEMDEVSVKSAFSIEPSVVVKNCEPKENFKFEFTLNSDLTKATEYTVTIATGAKDIAGNPLAEDYIWKFTTIPERDDDIDDDTDDDVEPKPDDHDPPQISLVKPTGDTRIPDGQEDVDVTIQISYTDEYTGNSGIDTSSIILKFDNIDITWKVKDQATSSMISYTLQDITEGNYPLFFEIRDNKGNSQQSENWMIKVISEGIDGKPPAVSFDMPTTPKITIKKGEDVTIQVSYYDVGEDYVSGIDIDSIKLKIDGRDRTNYCRSRGKLTSTKITYTTSSLSEGRHTIDIEISDIEGKTIENSWYLTIDHIESEEGSNILSTMMIAVIIIVVVVFLLVLILIVIMIKRKKAKRLFEIHPLPPLPELLESDFVPAPENIENIIPGYILSYEIGHGSFSSMMFPNLCINNLYLKTSWYTIHFVSPFKNYWHLIHFINIH